MGIIVDRIEGEIAVLLEGEAVREVPKADLAEGIAEGDTVFLEENGIWQKDTAETENRREQIKKKMDSLWG